MRHRIIRAAIVATLLSAVLGYGALEKHVVVRIEGRPVAVRTFGNTVGDVLERAKISLGPNDKVVPPAGATIGDGHRIDVFRAKRVTLVIDGKVKRLVVTGLTIQDVLREVNLGKTPADIVQPSPATVVRAGMTIQYRRAVIITVVHDGKTDEVITNAATVGAVLKEMKIRLGSRDKLVPAAGTKPTPGMAVRLLRVGIREEVRSIKLGFRTVLVRDRHLEYGLRRVRSGGEAGLRRNYVRVKYVDGRAVSQKLLKSVVVREPRNRVIAIGASFPGCVCDDGSQTGKATWYSQADGLSAAHRTLPFGTVVHVVNVATGKWVNVVIRDRGPYGDGRIIDLSDEAFRRIASLSQGVVNVKIYW
jgi:uncharacterized protein YabE (DUF348 family)